MKLLVSTLFALFLTSSLFATEVQPPSPEPHGVIERALSWIGVKYRFGSADERKGFDCAGLVRRAFASAGVHLPRTAAAQYRMGEKVALSELSPGDLVFFANTYKPGISHVGIYVGGNRFIHAASRRRRVVVDDLDAPYYLSRFAGARRMIAESEPALVAVAETISLHAAPPVGPHP